MTPEFAYFLKVNVAFVLFYAFYRLLFYKDTFFKLRRASLLAFFGLALLYPLLNIQEWVKEQEPMTEVIQIYSAMLPEMTVTPEVVVKTDWKGILLSASSYMYWGVMALLFVRFFIQLSSILLLAYRSRRTVIHGVPVYRLDKPAGPFSFFKMIFIHPESHSEKEIDEILTHECTHVFQWHSVDVMICELITVICWVNPFAWLLKREVRHNLEYLADNTVIQSGYDCKSYQYHLLGLAHHYQAAATLYNSFNVLHLKNRISMMNKKRSHGIGRTKYLIFIPLAAFLMLLSNIEAVARITGEIAAEAVAGVKEATEISVLSEDDVKVSGQVIDDFNGPVIGANVIVKGTNVGTIYKYANQYFRSMDALKSVYPAYKAENLVTYTDGYCYYYAPIEHFKGNENNMQYAIMRNNIYSLKIGTFKEIGSSTIIPEDGGTIDDESAYLKLTTTIAPWIVRFNTVNF